MLGVAFALCAAVCYGASTVVIGRSIGHARPTTVALVSLIAGTFFVAVVTVLAGLANPTLATISMAGLPWVVGAAILMFVVGRISYYSSIESIGPSRSAALSSTTTLATPVFALVVLGDQLGPLTWIGVFATFVGIWLLLAGRQS